MIGSPPPSLTLSVMTMELIQEGGVVMNGWIKLHRKLLSSNIFQNEKLLKVFIYCLMKATHTEFHQVVGKKKVALNPGQFVFGRRKAALELDMKESTVRDYINTLKDDNVITIEPTNKFSVITMVNWEVYQSTDSEDRQQNDSKMTAEGQQNDTYKNVKNEKNNNNTRQKYDEDTIYFQLAKFFYQKILANNPEHREPNFQKWADDIRKMIELDNRTEKQIRYLMIWVQQDSFEMANVLSPSKLRKRFDQLVIKVKTQKEKVIPINQGRYVPKNFEFDITAGEDWK